MTSGKEISKPSDDPVKAARSMQLNTDINANKQYNENISNTINWLDTTDTAVGQMGDVLQRVRELMVSSGNAGYSSNERKAIKDEINQKVGELSQIMNTNFDGKYLFGGTRGTTKPVDTTGSGEFYKDATEIKVSNASGWENGWNGKEITFGPDSSSPKITFATAEIDKKTTISGLTDIINSKLKDASLDGKLKAVPSIANNSIIFVNSSSSDIAVTGSTLPTGMVAEALKVCKISNLSNTSLIYNGRDGKEITDGTEKDMIGSKLKVEISQGVTMDYNVTATDIIEYGEGKDLRSLLKTIVNHLDGNNADGTAVDSDAVKKLTNDDLTEITSAMNNLLKVRSEVGAKQNRMDSAKTKNEDENYNMTEILSKTEDIDITEKTMEYATMQTVYMASLQTSAKVLQPSLMDYLR